MPYDYRQMPLIDPSLRYKPPYRIIPWFEDPLLLRSKEVMNSDHEQEFGAEGWTAAGYGLGTILLKKLLMEYVGNSEERAWASVFQEALDVLIGLLLPTNSYIFCDLYEQNTHSRALSLSGGGNYCPAMRSRQKLKISILKIMKSSCLDALGFSLAHNMLH